MKKFLPPALKSALKASRAWLLSVDLPRSFSLAQPVDEAEASKEFSIVLPVHDSPEYTERCLVSLERYGGSAEVIIVDDGSKKAETKALLAEYAERNKWRLITHQVARRHSRACEHGCEYATRKYICLLNSDTVVPPLCWKGIKLAFQSDPKIAVVGPMTNTESVQTASRRAGYCGDYWTNDQIYGFAHRFVSSQKPNSWTDVDHINGFAYFMPTEIWREFGGFHPDLPDYGNETELCHRIIAKGYRIILSRNSYIHHFGEKSIGRVMDRKEIQKVRKEAQQLIDETHRNSKPGSTVAVA